MASLTALRTCGRLLSRSLGATVGRAQLDELLDLGPAGATVTTGAADAFDLIDGFGALIHDRSQAAVTDRSTDADDH